MAAVPHSDRRERGVQATARDPKPNEGDGSFIAQRILRRANSLVVLCDICCNFARLPLSVCASSVMAGIYIHIPFCRKACTYCNFHFSTSLRQKDDMLRALAWELESAKDCLQGQPIETVYLGGGTPSLLSADELQGLWAIIENNYDTSQLREVTLEANPDDLNLKYLKGLSGTAINRLSIGVQSFWDSDLLYMNRAHNAQEADYAIKAAQDCGFEKLTIDLIYGTPGLSNMAWLENMARVQAMGVPHFSAYALTVEEGTVLHHNIVKKKQKAVDPEQAAQQLELLMQYAPAMGYEQYEISNFASKEQYALHNTNYWRGVPYLGIGPSAHSYDGRNRRSNIANNSLYLKSILQEKKVPYEEELLTDKQRFNEYVMTSLRTTWGCDLAKVAQEWGVDAIKHIKNSIAAFEEKNWLLLKDDTLKMTNEGKLFADYIASEMFMIED